MFVWIYNAIKTVVKFIEMSVYYILGNYYKKKKKCFIILYAVWKGIYGNF